MRLLHTGFQSSSKYASFSMEQVLDAHQISLRRYAPLFLFSSAFLPVVDHFVCAGPPHETRVLLHQLNHRLGNTRYVYI